jgi:4-amino-4-deoxy-L-arabinose transferase-like glycosyltransferase
MNLLYFFFFIAAISVVFILYKKKATKYTLFSIIILALIPRICLITNPNLGNNDEKYHALVAKNLSNHPLKPTLYDNPVLTYDLNNYASNHIWLSKPPITLWLMATSISFFGTSVFAVRLPSLILSILSLLILFHLGKILFNEQIGLMAMFFLAIHGTFIELSAGEVSSDHVDICVMFLFLTTIYGTLKAALSPHYWKYSGIIAGLLCGLLFLTKWQVAFLTVPVSLYTIYSQRQSNRQLIKQVLLAAISFSIIVAPWLYNLTKNYTLEWNAMLLGLVKPMHEITQGHSGPWYYYIDKIGKLFGEFIYLPLLLLPYMAYNKKSFSLSTITIWIFIPLILFSVMETKRFTYIMVIAPAIFLLTGYFINTAIPQLKKYKWAVTVYSLGLILLPIRFSIERIDFFTNHQTEYANTEQWLIDLKKFTELKAEEKTLIFNTSRNIETMFYTNCIAYPHIPNHIKIDHLKKAGYFCYLFDNGNYVAL